MAVRYSIEAVFDLPSRKGLLISGTLLAGEIHTGLTLRDETTGQHTTVLAVEFQSPADRQHHRTTLLVERTAQPIQVGHVLTTTT